MASIQSHLYVFLVAVLPPAGFLWSVVGLDRWPPVYAITIGLALYGFALQFIVIPHYTSPLRNLPSPRGDIFAIGHAMAFVDQPIGKTFLKWAKATPNDGILYLRGLFHARHTLILTSPDTIAEVLIKKSYEFEKPKIPRDFIRRLIGNGLVVVEGREHKFQRKAVMPSFQGHHIKALVPIFWGKALEFVNVAAKELNLGSNPGIVELGGLASRATLDIIGVAGFGHEFNALYNSTDPLVLHFEAITDPSNKAIALNFLAGFFFPNWLLKRLPFVASEIVFTGTDRARSRTLQLLADKRAALKDKSVDQPNSLAEVILRSGEINDDSLVDQLLTFLAAGHETTSSALQWAGYMLALNQTSQQRLRDELTKAFASNPTVDANFIESLEYLNGVSMETLRFWPTVPATARVATCDTTIADQVIPKGTHVVMAPYVINRLPALWGPDAEEFVPDRWIRKDGNTVGGAGSHISFLTFIHGPRSCIGQSFAKLELKCLLAALVMRFQFEMADPEEKVIASGIVTIKPENGLNLRMRDLKAL